jgi:mRNA interferase RelE/StbE
MYRVRLLDAASKDPAKLDKPVARRIVDRVRWLAQNFGKAHMEALTGDLEGLFKLRVGDHRVVYELLHEERSIIIHMIGHRREIYQRR